jgi:hypothetical protein
MPIQKLRNGGTDLKSLIKLDMGRGSKISSGLELACLFRMRWHHSKPLEAFGALFLGLHKLSWAQRLAPLEAFGVVFFGLHKGRRGVGHFRRKIT